MKVVTAEEMRRIDRSTIESIGIPGHVLMERAGIAVANRIKEIYGKKTTIILAGGGNNGGDGIVVGRDLFNSGWDVKVLLLIKEDKLSPDCLTQLRIARKMGVPIEFRTEVYEAELQECLVVDAMLGTGLNKDVEGPMVDVIALLNSSGANVISVDIPTGISSDTGQVMGIAVRANYTVTFGLPKRGHLLFPGAEYAGRLIIENIGFPDELLTSEEIMVEIPEMAWLRSLMPARPRYSHKGDYGHVLIVAGSRGKTGAAMMAAKACMRTGAGLVTIGVPESLTDVIQMRITEEMVLPLPDRGDGTLSSRAHRTILDFLSAKADVLCLGPGIGVSNDTEKLLNELLLSIERPVVIDADGINSITELKTLREHKAPIVLTPHPGEMLRLIQKTGLRATISDIEKDRIEKARSFARDNNIIVILKGAPTVTAGPDGWAYINSTGNPGMATAGAGDVLTGIIGALIGQGVEPLKASVLAVYLHGLSGDIASKRVGMQSLIASDIIGAIPEACKCLSLSHDTNTFNRDYNIA